MLRDQGRQTLGGGPMAKKTSRLTKVLLATAKDVRDIGAMSQDSYEKITLRHSRVPGERHRSPNVIRRKGRETIF